MWYRIYWICFPWTLGKRGRLTSQKQYVIITSSQGFSQIKMWIVFEATVDTTTIQDHILLFIVPWVIDLPSKVHCDQLFLSLEIIDNVTFAFIMWLKMKHALCWVPYQLKWANWTIMRQSFCHKMRSSIIYYYWLFARFYKHVWVYWNDWVVF